MKWKGRRTSDNIVDRRSGGGAARAGGIGLLGIIIVLVVGMLFGVDISPLMGGRGNVEVAAPAGPNEIDDQTEEFVGVVLADTEVIWRDIFEQSGLEYQDPKLVLFRGQTVSACGGASAAMGPFYCPVDQNVFLDTDFFGVMSQQLGASGDFAAAYVIAHEIGHHVQNQLGLLERVNALRSRSSQRVSNELSVRIELQADCYAGLWARHSQERLNTLEPGDIEEALDTAARIGDDTLQRAGPGRVVPDSFTHGSAEQRQQWFYRGYKTGDPQACDTFEGINL